MLKFSQNILAMHQSVTCGKVILSIVFWKDHLSTFRALSLKKTLEVEMSDSQDRRDNKTASLDALKMILSKDKFDAVKRNPYSIILSIINVLIYVHN